MIICTAPLCPASLPCPAPLCPAMPRCPALRCPDCLQLERRSWMATNRLLGASIIYVQVYQLSFRVCSATLQDDTLPPFSSPTPSSFSLHACCLLHHVHRYYEYYVLLPPHPKATGYGPVSGTVSTGRVNRHNMKCGRLGRARGNEGQEVRNGRRRRGRGGGEEGEEERKGATEKAGRREVEDLRGRHTGKNIP